MRKYKSIDKYLKDLEKAMGDTDKALILDALFDAEEHLSVMIEELMDSGEYKDPLKAIAAACEDYGDPWEVAEEYIRQDKEDLKSKKIRIVRKKQLKRAKKTKSKNMFYQIFSPYWNPRTYLAMLYLFLMFPLGIFYFTYIVTGLSVGLGLVVTVIGIPILILFLLSILGIGWLHGRMTEALLGVRMLRSKSKPRTKGSAWERLKRTFTNPRLYSTLLYLLLIFPLGIFYFVFLVTAISVSLSLIFGPVLWVLWDVWGIPAGIPGAPLWFYLLCVPLGFVALTWTMHLTNILGHLHGKLSRALLLRR
jgi:hypothetical protein